jgi:probable rRNA maturation factor
MKRPAPKAKPALKIDVLVQSKLWQSENDAPPLARRAVTAAAAMLGISGAELAIVLTDDAAIRLLNRTWRGADKATNVLSFPSRAMSGAQAYLGDIVLAHETIAREAQMERRPLAHHLAHLAVHGFLHLLGYDHVRDADAEAMERLEGAILQRLGIPDPYRAAAEA